MKKTDAYVRKNPHKAFFGVFPLYFLIDKPLSLRYNCGKKKGAQKYGKI